MFPLSSASGRYSADWTINWRHDAAVVGFPKPAPPTRYYLTVAVTVEYPCQLHLLATLTVPASYPSPSRHPYPPSLRDGNTRLPLHLPVQVTKSPAVVVGKEKWLHAMRGCRTAFSIAGVMCWIAVVALCWCVTLRFVVVLRALR